MSQDYATGAISSARERDERVANRASAIALGDDYMNRSPHLSQTFRSAVANRRDGYCAGGFKERTAIHIAELEERIQSLEALIGKLINAQLADDGIVAEGSSVSKTASAHITPPDTALENAKLGIFLQKYSQHLSKWLKPISDGERGRVFSFKGRTRESALETVAMIAARFAKEMGRDVPSAENLKEHISFHAEAIDWYFSIVSDSDFLCGRIENSNSAWRARFSWLSMPSNAEKVLSRKYNKTHDENGRNNKERTDSIALPQQSEETLRQMAEMIKQSGDPRDIDEIVKELAGGDL